MKYLYQLSLRDTFKLENSDDVMKPVSGLIRVSSSNVVILVLNLTNNLITELNCNTLVISE